MSKFKIDIDKDIVIVTLNERLTYETFKDIFLDMVNMAGFRPGMNALFDFTQVPKLKNPLSISSKDLPKIASFISQHQEKRGTNYKLAILAVDNLRFGLGRMFEAQAFSLPFSVMVFRDRDKAIEWLG